MIISNEQPLKIERNKNAIKLELPASIFLWIWDNISLWTRSSGFTDPEECIGSGAIISETFDE